MGGFEAVLGDLRQKEGDNIGKNRGLEASWPEKADGIRRGRRVGVGLSKAKVGVFCPSILNTPMAPCKARAGGLPTPAAITAGP